jgi:uncharacterized protein YlxW (UPF0749 family)
LDQDYEVVARRRVQADEGHPHSHRRGRHARALVVLTLFGLLIAVAAVQTARNRNVVSAGREQLISRIEQRRATALDQDQRISDLQRSISMIRTANRALGAQLAVQHQLADALGATTGWAPVTGDGVEIVVQDSTSGSESGLVRDTDLALVADGLWASGATAISVNGLRLTALSAFRNSAEVIRLNGTSLSPPYVVDALGVPEALDQKFRTSTAGESFLDVATQVGLGVDLQRKSELELPAAPASTLKLWYANPIDRQSKSSMQEEQ